MLLRVCLGIACCLTALCKGADVDSPTDVTPYHLGLGKPLGAGPVVENSGIVKSRCWPDLFWMHNDSGDEPRVYPVHRDGSVYPSERTPDRPGVLIAGAVNVDWEDITLTASGELVVADMGNNSADRRDLVLYLLPEPGPNAGGTVCWRRIFFHYPGQKEFPAPVTDFNYDAEAIFALEDSLYICAKHRSDTVAKLYRVPADAPDHGPSVPLEVVESFDARGQVVGADCDGKRVVLLTYESLWLFDIVDPNRPLSGPVRWLPYIGADDVEAVCFADEHTLLVASEEEGRLYEVPIDRFVKFDRTK